MSRPERNGVRDLSYSNWHRTLPDSYYAMDIDWLEFANVNGKLKPIAILEEKHIGESNMTEPQRKMMLHLADALGVQAFEVRHDGDNERTPSLFIVTELKSGLESRFNEQRYRKFHDWIRGNLTEVKGE